jgi:hypothetical protein
MPTTSKALKDDDDDDDDKRNHKLFQLSENKYNFTDSVFILEDCFSGGVGGEIWWVLSSVL